LTFLNVLADYCISYEKKWTCTPKRGRMVALHSNATHATCANLSEANAKSTSNE